jgi:hypothetical protein
LRAKGLGGPGSDWVIGRPNDIRQGQHRLPQHTWSGLHHVALQYRKSLFFGQGFWASRGGWVCPAPVVCLCHGTRAAQAEPLRDAWFAAACRRALPASGRLCRRYSKGSTSDRQYFRNLLGLVHNVIIHLNAWPACGQPLGERKRQARLPGRLRPRALRVALRAWVNGRDRV